MSTKLNQNPFNVQVGQVWVDNDPRQRIRREIRIQAVDLRRGYAMAEVSCADGKKRQKTTRVKLSRFNGTTSGYRLPFSDGTPTIASDVPAPPAAIGNAVSPAPFQAT